MLVLRRNLGEAIVLNQDIVIRVIAVQGDRVKLGIEAPPDVIIRREELCVERTASFWIRLADAHAADVSAAPQVERDTPYIRQLRPWQQSDPPPIDIALPE
ncbi:MAG TPA: carbon storage regulator [Ktedonobacterales bacterium]|nr:carbon storage regulator [Ktedonobacterales bacterium]